MPGFESLPGAVAGDHGTAHYGEPMLEQRALERGTGLALLADRAVIAMTGADRLTWLDSITSQAVARLAPGQSTELLVLDPQGRVEHAAAIVDDGETAWLITDVDDAAPLAKWLTMMRFRAAVEIAVRDDVAVLGYGGSGAAADLVAGSGAVLATWHDPWAVVTPGGYQYATVTEHPGAERDWHEAIVPAATAEALARSLGSVRGAGLLAVEALRVAAWRPRWARERDERLIPHEVDWIRSAVHLEKGCYRGQETIAKVHNLGHPPRRMVMLHLDGSDSIQPEPGAAVRSGEDEVGRVTSVAMHHELGPVALAIVARRVPADAELTVAAGEGEIAAAQEVIVPADAGATANVPRLTRLSRRPLKQD